MTNNSNDCNCQDNDYKHSIKEKYDRVTYEHLKLSLELDIF